MYATDDRSDYDPRTGCLKKFNSVALYHNAMLRIALDQLQRRRPEARIIYADYYTPYIQFARTPHLYGTSAIFFYLRFLVLPWHCSVLLCYYDEIDRYRGVASAAVSGAVAAIMGVSFRFDRYMNFCPMRRY
jgi:hypothetical protein